MSEIFWTKDGEGKVVSQTKTVNLKSQFYEEEIVNYKLLLDKEESLVESGEQKESSRRDAFKKVISELEDLKKEDVEELTFSFTPMLDYELTNMTVKRSDGLNTGCEGNPVSDQWADICSKHCIVPKLSYSDWESMKDPTNKKFIALQIFQESTPVRKRESEVKKKVQKALRKSLSAESTSCTSMAIDT